MPYSRARSKSGCVAAFGISRSNQASTSAWSSIHQRGKKVVSASSGIDDEGAAGLPRLLQQGEHPRHDLLPRVGLLVRAHLGGAHDDLSHLSSFFRRRSGAASG